MKDKRIAIIGGGVAGVSIVKFFVNDSRFGAHLKLDVYDAQHSMGRGYAFQEDSKDLIINLPTEEMSLTSDVTDFKRWLINTGREVESYNSRKTFGEYLKSKFESFTEAYTNINVIKSYVDDLIYNEKKETYTLIFNGENKEYDAVFLMTGGMTYSDPYKLKGEKGYIYNPYPIEENLNSLQGKIGIVGSGLSAIDSFRYLLLNGKDTVYVLSRSGELPSVRGTRHDIELQHFTLDQAMKYQKNGLIPLDNLFRLFEKEMAAHNLNMTLFKRKTDNPAIDLKYDLEHQDEVGKLQYLIIKMQDSLKELFKYLSRSDKQHYLEKYHPYLDGNHSPMPQEGAEQILNWIKEEKLVFLDNMEDVQTDDNFRVKFEKGNMEHFDILINATGPTKNIKNDDTPLLQKLYDRLMLEGDEFGGVLINQNHEIISPKHGTLKNFYTMGSLSAGTDYLITGVRMLASETVDLVNHYYEEFEE